MQLLQALRFQLVTASPYRSLQGLMLDLDAALHDAALARGGAAGVDDESTAAATARVHERAVAGVGETQCSEAPFLFSPQQIALEAV